MKAWKRIEPTKQLHSGHRTVISKTFIMNDGREVEFQTFDEEGSRCVDVIALTPENKIVATWQFRTGPEKVMLEVPGGMIDEGEDPETAARRELLEETGYASDTFEYLGKAYRDPYKNSEYHIFIAYDCKKVAEQSLDEHEEVEVELFDIGRFIELVKTDNTASSQTPALYAYDTLKAIEKRG